MSKESERDPQGEIRIPTDLSGIVKGRQATKVAIRCALGRPEHTEDIERHREMSQDKHTVQYKGIICHSEGFGAR